MKMDGVQGHVTTQGYQNWIEVQSFSFGVMRNISTKPGNVIDRETTKPSVSEVIITKPMDKATPNLFTQTTSGKAVANVEIDFCQTDGNSVKTYMKYTLSNVLLSNYQVLGQTDAVTPSQGSSTTALPIETLNLNFDKIEMKYTPYDEKHNASSPIPAGYDLNTAQKV